MKIAFVSPAFVPNSTLADFWDYGLCQVNQARALAALGHDVTVLARSAQNAEVQRDGVRYCFATDRHPPVLRSWQSSAPIIAMLKKIRPQVVHFHGLDFVVFLMRIGMALPGPTRIFAEYHGDSDHRFPLDFLQRIVLRRIAGLIFANARKADETSARLGLARARCHLAVECAPDRKMEDRGPARRRTGFRGDPVIIWNSRAIARRNPELVIDSYERHLKANPDATCRFYMMVPDWDAGILERIRAMSVRSEQLRDRFTLMVGRKPQAAMTDYYNSADFIISGSEDDPYGYGVADAMSCGVIPVVPESSTFLEITRGGKVGLLWDVTDPASLVKALGRLPTDRREIAACSCEVFGVFQEDLSMSAQARSLARIYDPGLNDNEAD